MSDTYRHGAAVLLLRPAGDGFEMLLVHKPRKRDAWQLPQGGIEEGETVEQGALRELSEEAGVTGVRVLGISDKVYQYDFPLSYRRFRPDSVKGQHISFIYALAPADVSVQVDNKEINGYEWITRGQMGKRLRREAYRSLVEKMLEEAEELAQG